MRRLINQLLPFLLLGIAIVVFAFGIMLLAYLFLFGAIIGLVLFIIAWIRNTFFPPRQPPANIQKKTGRIIDSNDWKEL